LFELFALKGWESGSGSAGSEGGDKSPRSSSLRVQAIWGRGLKEQHASMKCRSREWGAGTESESRCRGQEQGVGARRRSGV
jgi:hypothetical protein